MAAEATLFHLLEYVLDECRTDIDESKTYKRAKKSAVKKFVAASVDVKSYVRARQTYSAKRYLEIICDYLHFCDREEAETVVRLIEKAHWAVPTPWDICGFSVTDAVAARLALNFDVELGLRVARLNLPRFRRKEFDFFDTSACEADIFWEFCTYDLHEFVPYTWYLQKVPKEVQPFSVTPYPDFVVRNLFSRNGPEFLLSDLSLLKPLFPSTEDIVALEKRLEEEPHRGFLCDLVALLSDVMPRFTPVRFPRGFYFRFETIAHLLEMRKPWVMEIAKSVLNKDEKVFFGPAAIFRERLQVELIHQTTRVESVLRKWADEEAHLEHIVRRLSDLSQLLGLQKNQ